MSPHLWVESLIVPPRMFTSIPVPRTGGFLISTVQESFRIWVTLWFLMPPLAVPSFFQCLSQFLVEQYFFKLQRLSISAMSFLEALRQRGDCQSDETLIMLDSLAEYTKHLEGDCLGHDNCTNGFGELDLFVRYLGQKNTNPNILPF